MITKMDMLIQDIDNAQEEIDHIRKTLQPYIDILDRLDYMLSQASISVDGESEKSWAFDCACADLDIVETKIAELKETTINL